MPAIVIMPLIVMICGPELMSGNHGWGAFSDTPGPVLFGWASQGFQQPVPPQGMEPLPSGIGIDP